MIAFVAKIQIIGINPHILLPPAVLKSITTAAARDKGPIPVRGTINGHPFLQTLVKFSGAWRLYVNGPMLKSSGLAVGKKGRFTVTFDPKPRLTRMPPALKRGLRDNAKAAAAFKALSPSRKKEIKRYLNNLKSAATLERDVAIVLAHLAGKRSKSLAVLRPSI